MNDATPEPDGPCAWAYCHKWATIVVCRRIDTSEIEHLRVCVTHVLHAQVRGYVIMGDGPTA